MSTVMPSEATSPKAVSSQEVERAMRSLKESVKRLREAVLGDSEGKNGSRPAGKIVEPASR